MNSRGAKGFGKDWAMNFICPREVSYSCLSCSERDVCPVQDNARKLLLWFKKKYVDPGDDAWRAHHYAPLDPERKNFYVKDLAYLMLSAHLYAYKSHMERKPAHMKFFRKIFDVRADWADALDVRTPEQLSQTVNILLINMRASLNADVTIFYFIREIARWRDFSFGKTPARFFGFIPGGFNRVIAYKLFNLSAKTINPREHTPLEQYRITEKLASGENFKGMRLDLWSMKVGQILFAADDETKIVYNADDPTRRAFCDPLFYYCKSQLPKI